MFRPIISSDQPILLVGGGEASPQEVSELLTPQSPASSRPSSASPSPVLVSHVVAADGGAKVVVQAGLMPDLIVGDFDSLAEPDRAALPMERVVHVPDQDSTDFQKCLDRVSAPLILALGFLGGRLDHQLAAISAILKDPRPIVLIGGGEMCFVAPRRFSCALPKGVPVGLYPLLPTRLTSRGVLYPLTDAPVAPNGTISTSNTVVSGGIELESADRAVLVTLPRSVEPLVLQALIAGPPVVRAR